MVQSNTGNSGRNSEILSDQIQTSLEYETEFIGPMFVDGASTAARAEADRRPVYFKDFSSDAKGQGHRKGDTVTWRRVGVFANATPFNGTVNPQILEQEDKTLTMNYYYELSWDRADRLDKQRSFVDNAYYAEAAAPAWGETIEKTIMPQLILGDLSIGDGTGNVTTDSIQYAWLELEKQGIRGDNAKYKTTAYVTPNAFVALKREGKLSEYQLGGMEATKSWNSGTIKQTPMGIPICPLSSRTASSLGQAGGTAYQAVLTKDALMVGMVQKPNYWVKEEKIASTISKISVMSALWGVGVYRPEALVHLNYTYNNGL